MYKYLFQISLFSIFLGISFSNIALAIDYTTKGSSKSSSQKANNSKCTSSDLQEIKKFAHKAKRKIKKLRQIEKMAAKNTDYDKVSKIRKAMGKILDFFESDEFKAMEVLFNKCNKEIPRPKTEPPFWVPINN